MIELLSNIPYQTYMGLFLCSLFASYWLAPKITWLSRGLGLVTRKSGKTSLAYPTLGGIVVAVPFIFGISLLLLLRNQVSDNVYMVPLQMRGLFIGACLSITAGFISEILNLRIIYRTFLQLVLALTAYNYGFFINPSTLAIPPLMVTLLLITILTNFFHLVNRYTPYFLSLSILSTVALLFLSFALDQYRIIVICCLLSGSLIGISSHDKRERPDLGHTGEFFLGFIISVSLLQSSMSARFFEAFLIPLGISILGMLLARYYPYIPNVTNQTKSLVSAQARAMYLFKESSVIKIQHAENSTLCWSYLCQATQELGYASIKHLSNEGRVLSQWSTKSTAILKDYIHLPHSGGQIIVTQSSQSEDKGLDNNWTHFVEIVDQFDKRMESFTVNAVASRTHDKRVLLVNRYFSGMSATGQMVADLSDDLCKAGFAVTALTSSLSYDQSPQSLYGRNEMCEKIHIRRVPPTHFGRSNRLNRTMDFLFFYLFAVWWVLFQPSQRYTHLITFTDPPLIALIGWFARRTKGWKHIYNVQDLYPETAVALNAMSKGLLYKFCRKINFKLLESADAVTVIGKHMSRYLNQSHIHAKRLLVIPNWADGDLIRPQKERSPAVLAELGLNDVYTIVYAGNIGIAQEIPTLNKLIKEFRGRNDVQFVFLGGGARWGDLESTIREEELENVRLIAYRDRNQLENYLSIGDIGVVTLIAPLEGLAFPTRTYTYLAAGLPLLVISHSSSELKDLADKGLGTHFEPGQVAEIKLFIEQQIHQPRQAPSTSIRDYFDMYAERKKQTDKYVTLLGEL